MWIRFIDVAVTELSSVEAMLITGTAGEKEIAFKYFRYTGYCSNLLQTMSRFATVNPVILKSNCTVDFCLMSNKQIHAVDHFQMVWTVLTFEKTET